MIDHFSTLFNSPEEIKVVFDCAATCNGVVVTQKVMQGPDLMNYILGIFLRFREGLIAMVSDMEASNLSNDNASFWRALKPCLFFLCITQIP